MLFGDIEADAEQSELKIRTEMRRIVTDLFTRSVAADITLRQAALAFTNDQLEAIDAVYASA